MTQDAQLFARVEGHLREAEAALAKIAGASDAAAMIQTPYEARRSVSFAEEALDSRERSAPPEERTFRK